MASLRARSSALTLAGIVAIMAGCATTGPKDTGSATEPSAVWEPMYFGHAP